MDFSRVMKTTLVYTATMVLVAGLYLAIGYAIGQVLGSLTGPEIEGTVEVLSFVLFLMLLEPVKRRLQTTIENRFFPQRRDYSGRLATYAAEIAETIGAQAVADRTARTLQTALDLRGVCVAIETPDDGELRPVARASEFAPVPVDEDVVASLRHLLRQSHNLILLETIDDPKLHNLQIHFPYVIGLYAQGRVIGAILMSRPHDDVNLSGSQISFIAGVAAQAAAALEVARLYEEELARQRYREELATARRIQESLLPAEMPDIPGISVSAISRPAQAVGGDYYDVIRLNDGRFLVIVADVSGKGLAASLYMAEFHGMVHVACGMYSSPKDILTTLNEHLFEIITRGSFITATMLLFDTTRKSVSFARAGHTPIIRRNRSEVDTLIPTGVALGLCSRELFGELLHEYTVEYEPGETFILYSDGVSEAMNEQRVEFGEGRLLDVIAATSDTSADAMRNRILTHVEAFRGDAEQNDDIMIVVVHIDKEMARPLDLAKPLQAASR
jgi:serine phosphatase RsbU (regulator of sigma subunit)